MKRKVLFNNVYPILESLKSKNNTHLQYFIIKNIKKIKEEIEIAKDLLKDEDYDEYTKKRIELCIKYSEKDDLGNAKLDKDKYVIKETEMDNFNKDMNSLQTEYQLIIQGFIKKENDVLEEDIDIDFYKIKMENLPNDLNYNELSILEDMSVVIE